MQLPEDDKHTYTREYLEAMLAVLMGGVPPKRFSSATSPPARATTSTRDGHRAQHGLRMGYERTGATSVRQEGEAIFLGREIAQHRDYSEDTAIQIDKEVKRIVNGGYENAKNLLANIGRRSSASRRRSSNGKSLTPTK